MTPLSPPASGGSKNNIPQFSLPLGSEDVEPFVDLQGLLHEIYDQGAYDLRLDYSAIASRCPFGAIVPALSEADAVWVDDILRQQGLR
jgi:hypothetical protein